MRIERLFMMLQNVRSKNKFRCLNFSFKRIKIGEENYNTARTTSFLIKIKDVSSSENTLSACIFKISFNYNKYLYLAFNNIYQLIINSLILKSFFFKPICCWITYDYNLLIKVNLTYSNFFFLFIIKIEKKLKYNILIYFYLINTNRFIYNIITLIINISILSSI